MIIFPSETVSNIIDATVTTTTDLPLLKTYAWDYINNDFLLTNGKNTIVTGLEAVKVWIYKALKTQRYRYLAYSWNYGNELEDLISQGLSSEALKSESERYLKESLLINPYIESIDNIIISSDGSKVSIDFKVVTIYGEVDISV